MDVNSGCTIESDVRTAFQDFALITLVTVAIAGATTVFGASLGKASLVLLMPLSVLPWFAWIASANAQTATLTVSPDGSASLRVMYLLGPLTWRGKASDISYVRVRLAQEEVQSFLQFRIAHQRDIGIAFDSDESAMRAAKLLNSSLGLPSQITLTDDFEFPTSRSSMKRLLSDLNPS